MKKRHNLLEKRIDLTNLTYYVQPKRTLNPDPTPASDLVLEFKYLSQTLERKDILTIEYWLSDNKRDNFKNYNEFNFNDNINLNFY